MKQKMVGPMLSMFPDDCYTVELQWLEHFLGHRNCSRYGLFEPLLIMTAGLEANSSNLGKSFQFSI